MPLLQTRWPRVIEQFCKASDFAKDIYNIAENSLDIDKYINKNYLDYAELSKLDYNKQVFVIRSWLSENNIKMPSEKRLSEFLLQVINKNKNKNKNKNLNHKSDGIPELLLNTDELVSSNKFYLFYFNNKFYLVDFNFLNNKELAKKYDILVSDIIYKSKTLPDYIYLINKNISLNQIINKILDKNYLQNLGVKLSDSQWQNARIRFRRGGEIVSWRNSQNKSLKKIFNEFKVMPWMRDFVPLLIIDNKVKWIIGL